MGEIINEFDTQTPEIQALVEEYASGYHFAEDCLDTLLKVFEEKEASVKALVAEYGIWAHQYMQAKERLNSLGIDDEAAYRLGLGFTFKYKKSK